MSAVLLKDGTEVEDPRLDRLKFQDPRSRNYPLLTTGDQGRPLRSNAWRTPYFLDQGQEGACVEFGIVHRLLARYPFLDLERAALIIAKHDIYFPAQRDDYWPGGAYPGANPHMEGTSVLHGLQAARVAVPKVQSYRWAFGLEEWLRVIGYKSGLIFGWDWYEGMMTPDDDGFIDSTGASIGGHCLYGERVSLKFVNNSRTFGALDKEKSYLELHQSWGEDYGIGGRVKIRVESLTRLVDGADAASVSRTASV